MTLYFTLQNYNFFGIYANKKALSWDESAFLGESVNRGIGEPVCVYVLVANYLSALVVDLDACGCWCGAHSLTEGAGVF